MIPPLVAAGIPVAASVAGSLISSAFNAWQAGKNRRFQGDMSSTAHQREVADLRKAGLNPLLSATGGHGASTPPGSAAQAAHSDLGQTAVQGMALRNNLELQRAQINDINSSAVLKSAQTKEVISRRQKTDLEWDMIYEDIKSERQRRGHSAYDLERVKREFEFERGPGGRIKPWAKLIPNFGIVPQMGLKVPPSSARGARRGRWNRDGEWEN